jgi:hypothetical protein
MEPESIQAKIAGEKKENIITLAMFSGFAVHTIRSPSNIRYKI